LELFTKWKIIGSRANELPKNFSRSTDNFSVVRMVGDLQLAEVLLMAILT
jgi:hypothetical protein